MDLWIMTSHLEQEESIANHNTTSLPCSWTAAVHPFAMIPRRLRYGDVDAPAAVHAVSRHWQQMLRAAGKSD